MGKRENVSLSVSFYWIPEAYPVRWAYTPEEVPPWDVARGFPRDAPTGFQPDTELLIKESKIEKPTFHWWLPPVLEVPDQTDEVAMLRAILQEHGAFRENARVWEPLPPPASGYPRLVRKTFTKNALGYFLRNDVDVIADLAEVLDEGDDSFKISKPKMKRIMDLSCILGSPGQASKNTLESWVHLIWTIKIHLEVLEVLQLFGVDCVAEQAAINEETFGDDYRYRLPREAVQELRRLRVWRKVYDIFRNKHRWEGQNTFREMMARHLHRLFRFQLERGEQEYTPIVPALNDFGLEGRFNLWAWVLYRLANEWLGSRPLRRCEKCKNVFPAKRSNTRFCRDSCRQSAFRYGLEVR